MVEHVQVEEDHHLPPPRPILHPGGPHRSRLSLLCPQENPGVRAGRRPGNHPGSGNFCQGYQGEAAETVSLLILVRSNLTL